MNGRRASRRSCRLALLSCLLAGPALAHELDFTAIPPLTDKDSIAAAKLPAAELKQIVDQVEQTSFDVPDSWPVELRLRRMPIAGRRRARPAWHGAAVRRHRELPDGAVSPVEWRVGQLVRRRGAAHRQPRLRPACQLRHSRPSLVATTPVSAKGAPMSSMLSTARYTVRAPATMSMRTARSGRPNRPHASKPVTGLRAARGARGGIAHFPWPWTDCGQGRTLL